MASPQCLLGSLVCAVALVANSPTLAAPSPLSPADVLKVDLMGVFAHPDDETGVAATLAHYALGESKTVANVYCTRGEGGGNMVGTQWGPSLGILREAELRACLARLGIRLCYFLDRTDFAYTESLSITLERWRKEEVLGDLVRMFRSLRPEVVLTMDPAPTAGQHGNHQAAGLLATEAFDAAADPKRFPEQLTREGLHAWQVRKLYYSGWDAALQTSILLTNALPDGRFPWQVAGDALSQHRSQGFGNFGANPRMRQAQMFRLVKSVVPGEPETDLFHGLPADRNIPVPVIEDAPVDTPLKIEFQSRPSIANYTQWTRSQGIDRVCREMPSDLPIVAGETTEVRAAVRNLGLSEIAGEVKWTLPEGWASTSPSSYKAVPGRAAPIPLRVTAPTNFQGQAVVEGVGLLEGREVRSRLNLNVVPKLRVQSIPEEPSFDGSDRGWTTLAFHEIDHTRRWQGESRDDADCSATFRVGLRRKTLYLDIRVRDDMVVTNIAPDDIKGHWRSDSVEICLDPAAGAEHTLGTYKVGIFPFDTTGVVKGARDADANPGPTPETAPLTRLASFRTADGYRILAAIPLSEVTSKAVRRLGFNLLIYDGDKAGAALGENINRTRLAWAPRSGVQGRPEDWGRLDLD